MTNWLERAARRLMRRPPLRTYAEACEELGGVPWRTIASTDRWFLSSTGEVAPYVERAGGGAGAMETEQVPRIGSGHGGFWRAAGLLLAGGVAVLAVAFMVLQVTGSPAAAAPAAILPSAVPTSTARPAIPP